jgi:hypothetical protein
MVCQKRGGLPNMWDTVLRCPQVPALGKILRLCLAQEVADDGGFRNVEPVDQLLEFER